LLALARFRVQRSKLAIQLKIQWIFYLLKNVKNGAFANHTPTRPNIKSVTKQMRALGYEVFRETTFR